LQTWLIACFSSASRTSASRRDALAWAII
jgi:hypothetical protein